MVSSISILNVDDMVRGTRIGVLLRRFLCVGDGKESHLT
jgi:hypothetical protein